MIILEEGWSNTAYGAALRRRDWLGSHQCRGSRDLRGKLGGAGAAARLRRLGGVWGGCAAALGSQALWPAPDQKRPIL
jgi:hypothetical protein